MIRHLFKLVWNRKRTNALVVLEIAISFLVLFAVVTMAVYSLDKYYRPLGYSIENIWNVKIDRGVETDDEWLPEMVQTTKQLLIAARELPEVENAAAVLFPPYSFGSSVSGYEIGGRDVTFQANEVTDEFDEVLGMTLVKGRWFSREDDGARYEPVVLNREAARTFFGEADPVGKSLMPPSPDYPEDRVIGVIEDFRKDGELTSSGNYVFRRASLDDPKLRPPANIIVRVRPGTGRDFEEKLAARMQAVGKGYSYEVRPLRDMRAIALRLRAAPIFVAGLVAFFLLLMVGLGLTGVLWQNVTQRTKEIGLRRAKGATERDIHVQILGELFIITTLGTAVGAAIAAQFPLLALIGSVSTGVYIASFALSILVLYALTMLCGLYPSRLASRVQPAEALHYE